MSPTTRRTPRCWRPPSSSPGSLRATRCRASRSSHASPRCARSGGFDGRSFYAGDWLTWMRLALRWPVATIAEPLIANRVHAQAGTQASNASGLNGATFPHAGPGLPRRGDARALAGMARPDGGRGPRRRRRGLEQRRTAARQRGLGGVHGHGPRAGAPATDAGLIGSYLALVQAAGLQRPACRARRWPRRRSRAGGGGAGAARPSSSHAGAASVAVTRTDSMRPWLCSSRSSGPACSTSPSCRRPTRWRSPLRGTASRSGAPRWPVPSRCRRAGASDRDSRPVPRRPDAERWETVDAAGLPASWQRAVVSRHPGANARICPSVVSRTSAPSR